MKIKITFEMEVLAWEGYSPEVALSIIRAALMAKFGEMEGKCWLTGAKETNLEGADRAVKGIFASFLDFIRQFS